MSCPVSAWAMAWSRFRAACELLGYRQGKFCLILAAAQPHRPQNRELTRQIFQGCHFPLGEPGLPGLSSLEWMSEWVLHCRRDWENRLHERFFHLGRKKKESLTILPWVFGTWHQPSFPPLNLQMSHCTGCRHHVSLLTRFSPDPASFSQTNPLHLEGQSPGQLFTQPPYGVCFSIDPQMMCYYSGGAENYMTKPGLFLC